MNKTTVIMLDRRKRDDRFDIARGICILLMVMGHAGFGMEFHKIIHTFHMPIFFFISGYFYRPEKTPNIVNYFSHLACTLLLPYLVFVMFYESLHVIYSHSFSIQDILLQTISSNHNRIDVAGSLWFLLCLFSAKMIYFTIERAASKIGMSEICFTILIIVISLIANCLRIIDVMLPFCLDSALSCLLLIHCGYIIWKNKESKWGKMLMNLTIELFLTLLVLFLITEYFNTDINVRRNRFGFIPFYWISCFSAIFIIINLSSIIDKSLNKICCMCKRTLCFWGRESLVFLIFNELMLYIVSCSFRLFGVPSVVISDNYYVHALLVMFAMILLSCCANIARKRPFKYLFGKF